MLAVLRPAVGLEDIAVQRHLLFSKAGQVRYRPQAAPDEALDLLGTA